MSAIPISHSAEPWTPALARPRRHVLPHHRRDRASSPSLSSLTSITSAKPSPGLRRRSSSSPFSTRSACSPVSVTIWLAERAIERGKMRSFAAWWALTMVLGVVFIVGTGIEWHKLIYLDGLTIHTNLFGTTFYSLRRPARDARGRRPAHAEPRDAVYAHRHTQSQATPSACRSSPSTGILSTPSGSSFSPSSTSSDAKHGRYRHSTNRSPRTAR